MLELPGITVAENRDPICISLGLDLTQLVLRQGLRKACPFVGIAFLVTIRRWCRFSLTGRSTSGIAADFERSLRASIGLRRTGFIRSASANRFRNYSAKEGTRC